MEPPLLSVTEAELAALEPHIAAAGVKTLVAWRLPQTATPGESSAKWRAALPQYAAVSVRLLYHLRGIVQALNSVGIDPILFKGWAIARSYPEVWLRPLGDIDLFVPADREAEARQVIGSLGIEGIWVDLHTQTTDDEHASQVSERSLDQLYARSVRAELNGIAIRVLSPEDQLQMVCLHFMRHGGWRALWLCDIAVALETRDTRFDWTIALSEDGKTADAVACALGAAHALLGADLVGVPCEGRAKHLPGWLVPSILAEWSDPNLARHYPPEPVRAVWKEPRRLIRALRARWINPLEATMLLGAELDETPRAWHQARFLAKKGMRFLWRRGRSLF